MNGSKSFSFMSKNILELKFGIDRKAEWAAMQQTSLAWVLKYMLL